MKRFLLAVSIPFITTAFTSAYANYNSSYEGFYAGAEAGSAFVTASPGIHTVTTYHNSEQGGPLTTVLNEQQILKGNVFRGDIFGGFGWIWQQIFVSGEVFFGLEHYKETHTTNSNGSTSFSVGFPIPLTYNTQNNTTVQIKPWHMGIDFRPGFIINPGTLLYARVGMNYANVKLTSQTIFYGGDSSATLPEQFNRSLLLSENRNEIALRLGLGVETHLTDQLSFRADYVLTDYGRIGLKQKTVTLNLPSGDSAVVTLRASGRTIDNTIMAGLVYAFC